MRRPVSTPEVFVKAERRGTITTTKGIFHFDPDGSAEAQARRVPADVAEKAIKRGLVRKSRPTVSGEGRAAPSGPTVDQSAAERRARYAGHENEQLTEVLGMTGGETRDTTAFPTEGGLVGGLDVEGFDRGGLDPEGNGNEAEGENELATHGADALTGEDAGSDGDEGGEPVSDAPPNDSEGGDGGDAGGGSDAATEDKATKPARTAAAKRSTAASGRRPNAD